VIERAKSGERQAHAEIKGTIDKIKTAKATAVGIKPQRGSSKKSTKAEGPTAPDQETLIAVVIKSVGCDGPPSRRAVRLVIHR
jgi:hypothetical protein